MKASRTRSYLALILIFAALLRIYGLDWDAGQHTHPDERWIAMVAPTIRWPQEASDLLDPRRSTLNPLWVPDGQGGGQIRNFAYGHLPLYLHALAGHGLASLGKWLTEQFPGTEPWASELQQYDDYAGITVVGRVLSVLADISTIMLVFLLGRRIYSDKTALLGAALVALSVSHIQLAHFSTFDVITTFFITLSVYGSVSIVQARGPAIWPTIWAGAAAGFAVASKFSAAPLVAVLVAAQIIRAVRHSSGQQHVVSEVIRHSWPSVLLSIAVAGLAFFVTSPFAILDWPGYLKQIVEQGSMVRGQADLPFTRQYRNTTPFLYQIAQQVQWGLGWLLGITAFAGFGWTLLRQIRRVKAEELVLLGWAVPYFALTGTFMVKFMRYMLPLLPLFILMGSEMVLRVAAWAQRRSREETIGTSLLARLRAAGISLLSWAPALVSLGTVLWTAAFMHIYADEHPWIQASRWIYAHVPDGSTIAVEHWDDHLPLSLPEPEASPQLHGYRHLELPMYEPDTPDKLALIRERLLQADYIVFSTNRLYRTIPRLSERYPISTEFYRLVFAEELGFVQEATFTSYPRLFGIQIRDDDADESFTVYDHPKPIIFRKERDLSQEEWDALFSQALRQRPVWDPEKKGLFSSLKREPPPEGEEKKSLLLDVPVGDLPVVSNAAWNRWASESTIGATALWWLILGVLGWLAWPIVFVVCRGLRDRGYLLARSIALILVGYLIWLPASLQWLENGLPLTYGAIAVLTAVSGLLLWRYRDEMSMFLRERRGVILIGEGVFGIAFLAFVGIRLLNPDLWQPWQGGEKLMDIAYLNACLRSPYLPPYDPYFADGILNYYYYGQFLMSILVRLTGIRSTVAFNLAVPTLFALTVSNAFAIGYSLAGRILGKGVQDQAKTRFGIGHGLLAAVCVTVLGNMASATQVIERLGWATQSEYTSQIPGLQAIVKAVLGAWQILFHDAHFAGFNYWDPSRVVGYTINEFPYWSFLFADLHPHMMNIPFTLLVIALALNWLLRKPAPIRVGLPVTSNPAPTGELSLVGSSFRYVWQRLDWGEILNWVVWPLALGALWITNSWDWPAYAGLSGLVLLIVWFKARGRQGIVPALVAGVGLAAASLVLYWPFIRSYSAIYVGFGWSLGRGHTALGEFLEVWGLDLFLAVTLLLILVGRQRSRSAVLRLARLVFRHLPRLHHVERLYRALVAPAGRKARLPVAILSLIAAVVLISVWKGFWVLVIMVPLLALAAALLVKANMSDERRFVLALVFTAFLLIVGVELFYLKDHLDGDQVGWWRMNTLFKFYLQVWVMLGVAVGAALPAIWRAVGDWHPLGRGLWTTAFGLLLVAATLFVVLGTPARVIDRFPGARPPIGTLDGIAFMTVGSYTWPNENNRIELRSDYEAIRWLQDNVLGTPVIAEAPVGYYREFGGRVSSYTGLPCPYNEQHEREQRYGWQNSQQSGQTREFFITPDLDLTLEIARDLHIEYIYIGPLERTQYERAMGKFGTLAAQGRLTVAYQNNQVTIYQVPQ